MNTQLQPHHHNHHHCCYTTLLLPPFYANATTKTIFTSAYKSKPPWTDVWCVRVHISADSTCTSRPLFVPINFFTSKTIKITLSKCVFLA